MNQMTLYFNLKHKICTLRVLRYTSHYEISLRSSLALGVTPLGFKGSRAMIGYFHKGYKVMLIFIEYSTYVNEYWNKYIEYTLFFNSIILLSNF